VHQGLLPPSHFLYDVGFCPRNAPSVDRARRHLAGRGCILWSAIMPLAACSIPQGLHYGRLLPFHCFFLGWNSSALGTDECAEHREASRSTHIRAFIRTYCHACPLIRYISHVSYTSYLNFLPRHLQFNQSVSSQPASQAPPFRLSQSTILLRRSKMQCRRLGVHFTAPQPASITLCVRRSIRYLGMCISLRRNSRRSGQR
jgi:hypothetical protein